MEIQPKHHTPRELGDIARVAMAEVNDLRIAYLYTLVTAVLEAEAYDVQQETLLERDLLLAALADAHVISEAEMECGR